MKKILSQVEYMAMIAIIALSFFPWVGLLNQSAFDITKSVIENIDTVADIDTYAIALTLVLAVFSLIMGVLNKGKAIYATLTFVAPLVAVVFGLIDTKGDYLSSMELAYLEVVLLSILMLLKQFGIIKLKV